jgi:hypothetical protein
MHASVVSLILFKSVYDVVVARMKLLIFLQMEGLTLCYNLITNLYTRLP